MTEEKILDIFNELKTDYENVVLLASSPTEPGSEQNKGTEFVDGDRADLVYMLGRCFGNMCKNTADDFPEDKRDAAILGIFGIFKKGIEEAYTGGGSHDKGN